MTERQLVVQKKAEYGAGPLFKAAATIAGVMTGSALLVRANIRLLSALLAGPAAGIWLVPLALLPAGPALVACMYAFNRLLTGYDSGVYGDFVRSYRLNFAPALKVWAPYLVILTVIGVNLAGLPASITPAAPALRLALLVLALLVLTAAVHALLLLSRFSFRTRDLYRLSLYSFSARKRAALGNAGILFVTATLLLATTAYLLPVIAGAVVFLVCLNSRPLLRLVEEKFTTA